ncbi:MAG TPA: hypothetical protein VF142_21835, partial [Longimicrobium sp.]
MTRIHPIDDRRDGAAGRMLALGAVAAAAAAGFGVLARAAARRDTARADEALRRRTAAPRGHPARDVAEAAAPLGKWWTYVPAALGASAYLLRARGGERRARRAGAGAGRRTGGV